MRETKGIKRAAATMVFSAVITLSLLVNSGRADAASLDTRGGGAVAHGTITQPLLPALIKIVLPFGVSWED